jgi:hypothetical protein
LKEVLADPSVSARIQVCLFFLVLHIKINLTIEVVVISQTANACDG